jgi:hypothetical protein
MAGLDDVLSRAELHEPVVPNKKARSGLMMYVQAWGWN